MLHRQRKWEHFKYLSCSSCYVVASAFTGVWIVADFSLRSFLDSYSADKRVAYLYIFAGSCSIFSICISNQDIRTLQEREHPEKKTPTRPTRLCPNKASNMQRRCQRPSFVTERENDVSNVRTLLPCARRCSFKTLEH